MFAWRLLLLICCLAPLLVAAKCESTKDDDEDEDENPGVQSAVILDDNFSGATFAATWSQIGPGTLVLDGTTGNAAPSAQLDPAGTACELQSALLTPIFPSWQAIYVRVDVAIDGTPASGANATVAIEDAGGSDIASMTLSDGQVQVNTPGTYSVTQLWTTDSIFHRVEFLMYPNGASWWVRTHNGVGQISPIGSVGPVTGIRLSLRGTSPAPAWFDNVEAFVFGSTN